MAEREGVPGRRVGGGARLALLHAQPILPNVQTGLIG